MLFNSSTFVVFLVCALAAYWSCPWHKARQVLLLALSVVFYGWWDYRFVALIGYVTLVAYAAARAVHIWPMHKRRVVVATILLQLGQLAFFKYTNFALASVSDLASLFGLALHVQKLSIVLPIGVSFYTFHGISYVVDVYRGKLKQPQSLLIVALYIAFFPQLVAGPIVRADVFIPQTKQLHKLDTRDLIVGLKLVTIGLIYKGIFADSLGPSVDAIFSRPAAYNNATVVTAVLGFYSQIYFDFAGYSTIAIGVSRLFGFKLPKNFDYPYRSTSITEFWRRWHISLSSWLRDYLYIPLGGNRRGAWAQYRNLLITMLLGGLWHGASYNFILWGGLHGLALGVHKLYRTHFPLVAAESEARPSTATWLSHMPWQSLLWGVASWSLTQLFLVLTWVPFRAETFADTRLILSALLFQRHDMHLKAALIPLPLLLLPIFLDHLLVQNPRLLAFPWPRRPFLVLGLLAVALAVVLPFIKMTTQNFIYFQF